MYNFDLEELENFRAMYNQNLRQNTGAGFEPTPCVLYECVIKKVYSQKMMVDISIPTLSTTIMNVEVATCLIGNYSNIRVMPSVNSRGIVAISKTIRPTLVGMLSSKVSDYLLLQGETEISNQGTLIKSDVGKNLLMLSKNYNTKTNNGDYVACMNGAKIKTDSVEFVSKNIKNKDYEMPYTKLNMKAGKIKCLSKPKEFFINEKSEIDEGKAQEVINLNEKMINSLRIVLDGVCRLSNEHFSFDKQYTEKIKKSIENLNDEYKNYKDDRNININLEMGCKIENDKINEDILFHANITESEKELVSLSITRDGIVKLKCKDIKIERE